MNKPITITPENWETEVIKSDRPVLVDFWAAWCGPCRVMNPIINSLAENWGDRIKIAKANVEETEAIASKYKITSIPTILIFEGGKEIERFPGLISQKDLEAKLIGCGDIAA